jgi:hypothetical protein
VDDRLGSNSHLFNHWFKGTNLFEWL